LAATADERKLIEMSLAGLEQRIPEVSVTLSRGAALDRIGEALAARLEASARLEATLLQEVQALREDAAFALAPQGLTPLRVDELADPASDIIHQGAFEFVVPTQVEVRGLAAIAFHMSGENCGPEDRLEVSIVGGETNETLGAWLVPGGAIGGRRDWVTLDLALSLAGVRQEAFVRVRGHFGERGTMGFSQARGEEQRPALRLYAAPTPRLASSPFWIWPGADGRPTVPAKSLSGASWLDARLVGAAVELSAKNGEKRIQIGGKSGAMLIFPDVVLEDSAAIVARISREGPADLEVALSLIPLEVETQGDHASAEKASFAWSASHVVKGEGLAIALVVPIDAPPAAHVALSFRSLDAQTDRMTILECGSVWLVPRKLRKPAKSFVAGDIGSSKRDVHFEAVRLDEVFTTETYRHLDLSVSALSGRGRFWPSVKFKFFQELGGVGLEFRLGDGFPICFSTWPGTESDAYGPYFKISSVRGLRDAKLFLSTENDILFVEFVVAALPSLIVKLSDTGQLSRDDMRHWLGLVDGLNEIVVEKQS
jgi:hypothetical protein